MQQETMKNQPAERRPYSKSKPEGADVAVVTKALQDLGPMMSREIVEQTGLSLSAVSNVINRMRRRGKKLGKRAHIAAWCKVVEAGRDFPRPIFALGDKPDAPQPPNKTRQEINRDRRLRARKISTMNFVFNLRATRQKRARSGAQA